MKHWMMWTASLGFALGVAAAGPAIAAGKAASKSAAAPANPTEDWSITAVTKENGGFDYCAAGTRFDNGHALLIARNKADELILIVGLASDKLKPKSILVAGRVMSASLGKVIVLAGTLTPLLSRPLASS